jgi:Ca-activated chloride channel family protein
VNSWRKLGTAGTTAAALLVVLSACQSSGQGSSEPSAAASASGGAGAAASSSAGATPTAGPVGEASLDAPAEVGAGAKFEVKWTGPKGLNDYVTIVAADATKWTNESWFGTNGASPGSLVAPIKDGAYALWYVSDATGAILARRAIRVTPFSGALGGPAEVMAGSQFQVAWNGPNGPGDYVTIVKVGTTKWTDESYFNTTAGSPGKLTADLEAGSYELWYVAGVDKSTQATSPITVTPYVVTLTAAAQVAKGATFPVEWTGPDGPGDYVTIMKVGTTKWTNESFFYTTAGSPGTLTAPTTAGNYEVRYQSDRVKDVVFGTRAITVH